MEKRDLVRFGGKLWRVAEVHDGTVDLEDVKGTARKKYGVKDGDVTVVKAMGASKVRVPPPVSKVSKGPSTSTYNGGRMPSKPPVVHHPPGSSSAFRTAFTGDRLRTNAADRPKVKQDGYDQHGVEIRVEDNVWWRAKGGVAVGEVLGWSVMGVVVEDDDGEVACIPAFRLKVVEHNPPPESLTQVGGLSKIDTLGLQVGMDVNVMLPCRRGGDLKEATVGTIRAIRPLDDQVQVDAFGWGKVWTDAENIGSVKDYGFSGSTAPRPKQTYRTTPVAPRGRYDSFDWLDDPALKKRAKKRQQEQLDVISTQDLLNDELKSQRKAAEKKKEEVAPESDAVPFRREGSW